MRSLRREGAVSLAGAGRDGSGLSRREILAGGIGTGALIALPDLGLSGRSDRRSLISEKPPVRHAFLYGIPDPGSSPAASLAAVRYPASRPQGTRDPVAVAVKLAAAPVSSPDGETTALATVGTVPDGARVTLTLVDTSSAAVARRGSVTITGVPDDSNILVTPVFAPGSATIPLVLAITVPTGQRLVRKRIRTRAAPRSARPPPGNPSRAGLFRFRAPAPSRDRSTSPISRLSRCPRRRQRPDLFLWTTREPQPDRLAEPSETAPTAAGQRVPPGFGKARLSVPAPAPWPGGEPVAPLADRRRGTPGQGPLTCRSARRGPRR